jgi:FtsP/CotA-like multicopper oxidase with cupredoxin domain
MTTRREALVMIGLTTACVAVSANPAHAEDSVTDADFIPDRELALRVGDNFQRQHWLYAGQRYVEDGKLIVVDEGECIRLILINDTDQARSLLLDGASIEIAAKKSCKHDFIVAHLQPKVLSDSAAGITRTIQVRPTYQRHAAFLA